MLDLRFRGASILDGSGAPARVADVGVRDGRIVFPERHERALETLDVGGLALMPGIVDVHTHYDAQITWDPTLSPSVALGVTTAILGNCGFGIAPCPQGLRGTMLKSLSRPSPSTRCARAHRALRQRRGARRAIDPPHGGEALQTGAAGFASSFSPNHSGWGGQPMPSTIASDEELRALTEELRNAGKGVFVMATGARATPQFMESIAAATGRPGVHGHGARHVQPRASGARAPLPGSGVSRAAARELQAAEERHLFYGDWSQVELDGVPVTRLSENPLDFVFDLPLDTQLVAKLYQNDDAGVVPLLRHPAGVVALSDAGAHLIYLCDAGFGLHFLAHWVRETGSFTLEEGVRRLTSDPARRYRIPQRGTIVPGAWADLVRTPRGVHGVWVNGLRVHDGVQYIARDRGPGRVLRTFDS